MDVLEDIKLVCVTAYPEGMSKHVASRGYVNARATNTYRVYVLGQQPHCLVHLDVERRRGRMRAPRQAAFTRGARFVRVVAAVDTAPS